AQRARDATLAARVREAAAVGEAGAVVLIAGAGHVRADRGVPAALGAELGAAAVGEPALVTVAFVEVVRGELDPVSYLEAPPAAPAREPFDFLWFTPRVDEDDPCAGMHGGG
ncbi:MAG: ChaN family lipoprotein, partial [Myxococcales bacterium]|nr:ChaN family lipoprotein [Myxococcales bacterium]